MTRDSDDEDDDGDLRAPPERNTPAAQPEERAKHWGIEIGGLENDRDEIQDDLDNNADLNVTMEEKRERVSLTTANAQRRVSFDDEKKAALNAATEFMSTSVKKHFQNDK